MSYESEERRRDAIYALPSELYGEARELRQALGKLHEQQLRSKLKAIRLAPKFEERLGTLQTMLADKSCEGSGCAGLLCGSEICGVLKPEDARRIHVLEARRGPRLGRLNPATKHRLRNEGSDS